MEEHRGGGGELGSLGGETRALRDQLAQQSQQIQTLQQQLAAAGGGGGAANKSRTLRCLEGRPAVAASES